MKIANKLSGFLWESMTRNNCNTYLIDGPTRILIDPGHKDLLDHVEQGLSALNYGFGDIGLIVCTHAHPDHIEGVSRYKDTPALFAIHPSEWELVKSMKDYVRTFGMSIDDIAPDFFLKEGELNVNGVTLHIIHTPGHSKGSISIYWPEQKALFTGDVVFKESFGRTDLPGGNGKQLKDSIVKLSRLDVEYLLPGHGGIIETAGNVRANFQFMEHHMFHYVQ